MARPIRVSQIEEECESKLTHCPQSDKPIALLSGNGLPALVGREMANRLQTPLVPINPLLQEREVEFILRDSQAATLLCDQEHERLADSLCARLNRTKIALGESGSEALLLRASSKPRLSREAIGATLIYTSGTTGTPKGCYRSAEQEYARACELIDSYSISAEDIQLIASPLAHSAPGIFLRAATAVGAETVIMPRFRAEEFLSLWETHEATFFFLVPTQFQRLLDSGVGWQIPAAFRAAICAGAPLAKSLRERITEWVGRQRFWQFYGSSETGTISIAAPGTGSEGVGRPVTNVEIEIRDSKKASEQESNEVQNLVGEIFVRSPTVMSGYWPTCSKAEDGFVSVGDLGYRDLQGNLHLVDRKNDTIISGGVNVYPAEVEAVLIEHPQVEKAVVVGIEDEQWGQRVAALLVCCGNLCPVDLRVFCKARLAPYKIPKQVELVSDAKIPIGASGKPLRREARRLLQELRG